MSELVSECVLCWEFVSSRPVCSLLTLFCLSWLWIIAIYLSAMFARSLTHSLTHCICSLSFCCRLYSIVLSLSVSTSMFTLQEFPIRERQYWHSPVKHTLQPACTMFILFGLDCLFCKLFKCPSQLHWMWMRERERERERGKKLWKYKVSSKKDRQMPTQTLAVVIFFQLTFTVVPAIYIYLYITYYSGFKNI